MLYRQLHMFAPKLVHVTRCVTRDRLTFVLLFEAVVSYDVVVLLRINCLERFTVCRLETTSNRPEHLVAERGCWYVTMNVCFHEFDHESAQVQYVHEQEMRVVVGTSRSDNWNVQKEKVKSKLSRRKATLTRHINVPENLLKLRGS